VTKIAVTGSSGLIGRELVKQLTGNYDLVEIDIAIDKTGHDIALSESVTRLTDNCDGIIHLAAVSRVAEAQDFPLRTWASNVTGTHNILDAALNSNRKPWVIHASSREVYGNQPRRAIPEETPMTPLNIYGRSKAAGEGLVYGAQDAGANVAILRFANVYGDIYDYSDRVIPAFSRAAVNGTPLRVDDASVCMDFTHVVDVSRGVVKVVDMLVAGEKNLPPIHYATGTGTTLGELARIAVAASDNTCELNEVERREASVSCFIGDPTRARTLLGWTHETPLQTGFSEMVEAFRKAAV